MAFRHHHDDGTFQGPIISGAPFRDTTFDEAAIGDATFDRSVFGEAVQADFDADTADHRDGERVVPLTRVPTRFAGDVVVAELQSCGIKAGVVGRRVVVFERDLATAREIITQTDDDPFVDDDQAADDEPDFGQQ